MKNIFLALAILFVATDARALTIKNMMDHSSLEEEAFLFEMAKNDSPKYADLKVIIYSAPNDRSGNESEDFSPGYLRVWVVDSEGPLMGADCHFDHKKDSRLEILKEVFKDILKLK